MEWVPTNRVEVVKVASPLLSVPVPSVVVPSLKVTVPVGVPPVDFTVAVKVTDAPNVDGFREETSNVEDFALFTVWVSAGDEVLPLKLLLPP